MPVLAAAETKSQSESMYLHLCVFVYWASDKRRGAPLPQSGNPAPAVDDRLWVSLFQETSMAQKVCSNLRSSRVACSRAVRVCFFNISVCPSSKMRNYRLPF